MSLAVIGAGWAGLAAAVRLHKSGHELRVYEAAPAPGGRARPVVPPGEKHPIDNGQHLLLGAYEQTLALMRELGVDLQTAFHTQTLALQSADGRFCLKLWKLPAPLHYMGPALAGQGLAGWRGRLHLLRVALSLHSQETRHLTAARWLDSLGCPEKLMSQLWAPLCLAALNTPIQQADTILFRRVLRESLGAGADASRMLIPRSLLHELWPAQACKILGERLVRHTVRRIEPGPAGSWLVDGTRHAGVVLATPFETTRRLLQGLDGASDYLSGWPRMKHSAIGTLTLFLEHPWQSGINMAMLWDDPARGKWGQWVFDRSSTAIDHRDQCLVHVVISGAERYAGEDGHMIAGGIIAQLREQLARPLPAIRKHLLITEKRATFDAVPGLQRPGTTSPWRGLVLAGDWTDTAYPAVLEGAVRSGLRAADVLTGRAGGCSLPPARHRSP